MYILLGSISQISKAVTLKSYHLFELPGKRLKRATQDLRARSCIRLHSKDFRYIHVLNFHCSLWRKDCCFPHCTGGEMEAQRGLVTSWGVTQPGSRRAGL